MKTTFQRYPSPVGPSTSAGSISSTVGKRNADAIDDASPRSVKVRRPPGRCGPRLNPAAVGPHPGIVVEQDADKAHLQIGVKLRKEVFTHAKSTIQ